MTAAAAATTTRTTTTTMVSILKLDKQKNSILFINRKNIYSTGLTNMISTRG